MSPGASGNQQPRPVNQLWDAWPWRVARGPYAWPLPATSIYSRSAAWRRSDQLSGRRIRRRLDLDVHRPNRL